MRFSVVIPSHNRAGLLAKALASVWAQTLTDYEIIVSDDGSTDETRAYLRTLGDRVRVVAQPHAGPGCARNAGVAASRGLYVVFLDSDDVWFPWTLEVLAQVIEKEASPAITALSVVQFTDEDRLSLVERRSLRTERYPDLIAASRSVFVIGSGTIAVRRELFTASGGFTPLPVNGEDQDLLLRLGDTPGFVRVIEPAMVGWRRHQFAATRDLNWSIAGAQFLIERETTGQYPGGREREAERREILTRIVRPVTFQCLFVGRIREGFRLYRQTLPWHLGLYRWRYLLGFPIAMLGSLMIAPIRKSATA
jgi:glycosyltransferase involved in cell wall biosynthesis